MAERLDFRGQVVVVTGAGQGVGKAYAVELASRGAKVVVNDLGATTDGHGTDQSIAEHTAAEIRAAGGDAIADRNTVATPAGGQAIVDTALARWGRIDGLIHNAGFLRDASFPKLTQEGLDSVLDVHLRSSFYVAQPAFRAMKESGGGRILLTSSSSGLFGTFGQSNYSAAKMGVVGLARVLAIEGIRYGIKTNVIAPYALTRLTSGAEVASDHPIAPARLAPVGALLTHPSCPSNGEIFQCGAGFFGRVSIMLSHGYVLPDGGTAEDLLDHWEEVRTGAQIEPETAKDLGTFFTDRTGRR